MSTSGARRERRLAYKRLGRPPGTTASLLRDRQRFAIATWVAFAADFGPHVTARLVTVFIESHAIRIEDVGSADDPAQTTSTCECRLG